MATVLDSTRLYLGDGLGIRPPLKWAGGKRWLVSTLRPMFYDHGKQKRLVEPFCGGMAVALGLLPDDALLNDINPHAVNFYRWLQKGLALKLDMQNDEISYYRNRARFNQLIAEGKQNSKEAAELFYYLNRTGFNGLCRFNRQGSFNVPYGRYKNLNYQLYTNDFSAYKPVLRHWNFTCGDFEDLDIRRTDLIYADPPYDVEFTQYSKEVFDWAHQERLAEWLARHRGPVIASNQGTERIKTLYAKLGFNVKIVSAPRMISCNGDRARVDEILATRGF